MIIIEGMDNSGKSTLARLIAHRLGYRVKESEGPPRSREEINERARRYADLENTVVVRHPVVSNAIYGKIRGDSDAIDRSLCQDFYAAGHLIIYCDPKTLGLSGHQLKEHDSKSHLAMIADNYTPLLMYYRYWALDRAHMLYRIGDDTERLLRMMLLHDES